MDTYNKDSATPAQNENRPSERGRIGRVIAGLIVVAVGIVYFAHKADVDFPSWIFSWGTLLITLGLFVGFKHSFKNHTWLVLVVIGSFLLAGRIFPYSDISHYTWPLIIIMIGLVMIFRSGKKNNDRWSKWDKWDGHAEETASDDYLDSTVIFGGSKKIIISKNFKGGDITTIFGGTDINFTQADLDGRIVLDITTIFGGNKLIVPPHWKIQSQDVVAIFGGIDDKRAPVSDPSLVNENKVLVLHGTCIFGGIDIKSF